MMVRLAYLRQVMPFERFKAWQLAHGLTLAVYEVSEDWPARLCLDLKYLSADQWSTLEIMRSETSKVLWGLYHKVRRNRSNVTT